MNKCFICCSVDSLIGMENNKKNYNNLTGLIQKDLHGRTDYAAVTVATAAASAAATRYW